jgi:hypothetical protein
MNIHEIFNRKKLSGYNFDYSYIYIDPKTNCAVEFIGFGKTPEEAFESVKDQIFIAFGNEVGDDGMLEYITDDGCREAFCTIAEYGLWSDYGLDEKDFSDWI